VNLLIEKQVRYDPESGAFHWLTYRRRRNGTRPRPGDRADKQIGRYMRVSVMGGVFAHRLAFYLMTGKWPDGVVDHINRNPTDNRWCNLRDVSHKENLLNQSLSKNNKSGHIGVSKTASGYWRAEYCGKWGGQFACKTAAIIKRKQMELAG
jgi:hypothetical protein